MNSNQRKVLITGGAGYIGSHTALLLLNSSAKVTVLDNLCNSSVNSLDRVADLAGCSAEFLQVDIRNLSDLQTLFHHQSFDAV